MHPKIAQMIEKIKANTPALQAGTAPGGLMTKNLLALIDAESNSPKITPEQYAEAVALLVKTAQGDTSGSRASAQVLLSAYNSYAFQLGITELCNLDADHYEAALAVIRGRVELRHEPHEMIQDGPKHFEQLWEQWEHYKCGNRHTL